MVGYTERLFVLDARLESVYQNNCHNHIARRITMRPTNHTLALALMAMIIVEAFRIVW